MGPQLSRDEIAQIRRFIIEERRRTPRSTERELWERTQERFTDFRYLTNANFRYHYRQLNEASRQQGIEIGDLDPEVHGRSGRDQRSQSLHGLDGLRQQLLLAKKAEAGARQELEARVRERQHLQQQLDDEMARLNREYQELLASLGEPEGISS